MGRKINIISIVSAILPVFSTVAVQAQNTQNFVRNEENRIQQDAAAGFINQKQDANLQNQEAQIMQQENIDKSQNGGKLTGQERQQIKNETRNLNGNLNYDTHNGNPNSVYPPVNQWQNNAGYQGRYQGWGANQNPNTNWNPNFQQQQQNWQNNPNAQQQNQQQNMNGHHHRRWQNYNNNQ